MSAYEQYLRNFHIALPKVPQSLLSSSASSSSQYLRPSEQDEKDDDMDEDEHDNIDSSNSDDLDSESDASSEGREKLSGKRLSDIELQQKVLNEPFVAINWECPPSCHLSKSCVDQRGFIKFAKDLRLQFWGSSIKLAPSSRQRHDMLKEKMAAAYLGNNKFEFTYSSKVWLTQLGHRLS